MSQNLNLVGEILVPADAAANLSAGSSRHRTMPDKSDTVNGDSEFIGYRCPEIANDRVQIELVPAGGYLLYQDHAVGAFRSAKSCVAVRLKSGMAASGDDLNVSR